MDIVFQAVLWRTLSSMVFPGFVLQSVKYLNSISVVTGELLFFSITLFSS